MTTHDVAEKKRTTLGLYVTAAEAYEMWKADPDRISIIDVRTPEEYIFVGHAEMDGIGLAGLLGCRRPA